MPEFLDTKRLATEAASKALDRIIAGAEKRVRESWARHRNRNLASYASYIEKRAGELNGVRNLIYEHKSANLYDIYVPATFVGRTPISDDQLIRSLNTDQGEGVARRTRALVVAGRAGSGKSLFMRHAFFSTLKYSRVPIFVELRGLNSPDVPLEKIFLLELGRLAIGVMSEQVDEGLKAGLFTILLDGLDELKGEIRGYYEDQILRFVARYPLCPAIVSSRPMDNYKGWSLFETREILPLDVNAADLLIRKIEFPSDVKTRFSNLLRVELFETHFEFVSNPLLCSVMLLTFADSGRISANQPDFFQDAFSALWSKHDIRKVGGEERTRKTGFDKATFERLFSAFCASSYRSSDYEMREDKVRSHLELAKKLTSIDCAEVSFVYDITTGTSLAFKEGEILGFYHRLFQEFFCAIFLANMPDHAAGRMIEELSDRVFTDSVLPLLLVVREDKIERNWVLPVLEQICESLPADATSVHAYAKFVCSPGSGRPRDLMRKIRSLYELEPTSDDLWAAYDAGRHIGSSVLEEDDAMRELFASDRASFIRLRGQLLSKYASERSAFDALILAQAGNVGSSSVSAQ
ncbi:MAG: putative signal transduction protein with Nacht domain [Phenylobacterium sp.]|nr:putative signal transduction protein with Nacht domain [Phenylobacterium sp.]